MVILLFVLICLVKVTLNTKSALHILQVPDLGASPISKILTEPIIFLSKKLEGLDADIAILSKKFKDLDAYIAISLNMSC